MFLADEYFEMSVAQLYPGCHDRFWRYLDTTYLSAVTVIVIPHEIISLSKP
jgi:hypothetical protein